MARVLIAVTAVPGHILPLLAVAAHLARLGHDIVVHTGSVFRHQVEEAGGRFVPFHPKIDHDYRHLDTLLPHSPATASGLAQAALALKHLFADAIPDQYAGLCRILAEFDADLILTDTMFCGSFPLLLAPDRARPAVIALGHSPLALSSVDTAPFGTALPPPATQEERMRNAALYRQVEQTALGETQRYFNAVLATVGAGKLPKFLFDSMTLLPDLFLQLSGPAFEYPRRNLPDKIRFIGPLVPPSRAIALPPWWDTLDAARPVVVVTQGTVQNGDLGRLVGPTLTALAGEPVTVVVTTGGVPVEAIPTALPANARAAQFLPFDRLLPRAALLVTNGGYGAVTQALSFGVPLIVAGDSEEKPEVAARVAWSGAGLDLRTGRPSPTQLHDAVRTILARPQYRRRAQVIRDDFARYNALDAIAALVAAKNDERGRSKRIWSEAS
jgi:MGT family glycosyltransferase